MALAGYEDLQIDCGNDNCSTCYKTLVTKLLENDKNFFTLQNTFFPPNDPSPVFVEVTYQYSDMNETQTFFWSSSVYFFFHPVRIFQFTSLLFSDPSLRYSTAELYLPGECINADNKNMMLLTQRVSIKFSLQLLLISEA